MLIGYKNIFNKKMLFRGKVALLLSVILISIVTTLPMLISSNVGALGDYGSVSNGPIQYIENTIKFGDLTTSDEKIKSIIYFKSLKECFRANQYNYISAPDVKTGKWFEDGVSNGVFSGVYMWKEGNTIIEQSWLNDRYAGVASCNSLVKDALTLWGVSPIALLCGMGYKSISTGRTYKSCIKDYTDYPGETLFNPKGEDPNVSFDQAQRFNDIILYNRIFPSDPYTTALLTNVDMYLFYRQSLENSCIPNIGSKSLGKPEGSLTKGADLAYTGIQWVDISASPPVTLTLDFVGDRLAVYDNNLGVTNASEYGSNHVTCADIVKAMNLVAPDYLDWAKKNAPEVKETRKKEEEKAAAAQSLQNGEETCGSSVSGVGWIVCPIFQGLAAVNQEAWNIVEDMLATPPLMQNDTDTVYQAWSGIRNIANIVFVIISLIMIFSQVSSIGLSNYGVKKLLPRLIIAAIMVNLSYFIVQVAIDLSNIIGSGLYDLVKAGAVFKPNFLALSGMLTGAVGTGAAIAGIVIFTASPQAAFFLVLPLLATFFLGIITAFLTLMFRQAFIPILVILSPLAFVAYLLPNTESWFKKWTGLLLPLLMLYPIAAVVFGGAILIASLFSGSDQWYLQLVSLIIMVVPLFSLPFLAKQGGTLLGKVNGALSGLAEKSRKPLGKWADTKREEATVNGNLATFNRENPNKYQSWRKSRLQRNATQAYSRQFRAGELNRSMNEYVGGEAEGNADYRASLAEGGGKGADIRALAGAKNILSKLNIEEVTASKAVIKDLDKASIQALSQGLSAGGLNAGNNLALQEAAMQKTFAAGDIEGINKILDLASTNGTFSHEQKLIAADTLDASTLGYAGHGVAAAMRTSAGSKTSEQLGIDALGNDSYSPEKFAAASSEEVEFMVKVANDNPKADHAKIKANAGVAMANPLYSGKLSKQKGDVEKLSKLLDIEDYSI